MIKAQGKDFSVSQEFEEIILRCKKCSWEINFDRLDTLEDIEIEIMGHDTHE